MKHMVGIPVKMENFWIYFDNGVNVGISVREARMVATAINVNKFVLKTNRLMETALSGD